MAHIQDDEVKIQARIWKWANLDLENNHERFAMILDQFNLHHPLSNRQKRLADYKYKKFHFAALSSQLY